MKRMKSYVPKIEAVNAMDRGMMQRGYAPVEKRHMWRDQMIIRLYKLSDDLDGPRNVSVCVTEDEANLPFQEFTAMMTARIERAVRNVID